MKPLQILLTALCAIVMQPAGAWSNHTLVVYRELEKMPAVAQAAPVTVEPIEAFLKAQEPALEHLLAEQEAWARVNVTAYAPRPDALAFRANPARPDDARRLAFLMALRVSPNSKLALYVQPDPRSPAGDGPSLPFGAVSFLPEQPNTTYRFIGLQAGATVPVLQVVAAFAPVPVGRISAILEVPGGFIDEGEDPQQAIARELLEETGYSFSEYIPLGKTAANPGVLDNFTYLLLATGGKKTAEQALDANEEIAIRFKPLKEVRQMLKENKIVQAMHALCMFYAFEYLDR